ncbi:MAG: SUMF1/EgtB/PvdO family nonheme iron enzyme [Anaerolineae bacterium]|nr:SUMF1/EgtB/PvdO family nonheme iron enzyme [Anaerolineae bacterium]
MSDDLNKTVNRLKELLQRGDIDETMFRMLLTGQGLTPAQIEAALTGFGNIAIQDSLIEAGERGVVGSSAGRDIVTGDLIQNQTILQAADPAESRQANLRQQCLRRLAHRCNILPLAALGGEESAKAEVSLADVYVNLDTKTRVPLTKAEKKERPAGQDDRPLTVLEAATQQPRLVLLGEPGSGKSTFVQQLAAHLALARLGEVDPLPGWPARAWPMLTLLRDLSPRLAAIALADPLTESQEEALVAAMLAQWQADLAQLDAAGLAADLPNLLTNEPVVLIFDGLDEVPEAARRHVRLAVQSALRAYPAIQQVIITCRIRSYTGPALLPDFTSHTLAPFTTDQIRTFVKAWYNTQARLHRLTAAQAAERTDDLQGAAVSSHLRELAQNPMLLTTMALIHQREVGLPRERVRLYEEAVKVLLTRWQKRKEIAVSERLQDVLNDQLKLRQIMERLAYEVHRRQSQSQAVNTTGQGDLPRLEALGLLEDSRYLGDIGLAHEFLDYADQRAGLLQGRGGEEGRQATAYTFPHRTFQEYLAGCYMVTGRQRQVVQEYWQRLAEGDFWYLAGQLGAEELLYNRRDPEEMLDLAYALCPSDEPATPAEWRAVVWSGQMAVTRGQAEIAADTGGREGGARYLRRLIERLKGALRQAGLKAIERAEAGNALAVLGDDRPGIGLRPDGLPDIAWCDVPAGPFVRGSNKKADPMAYDDELPQQTINVSAFKISRYPITNAQYTAFVEAGGYKLKSYWREAHQAGYWQEGQFKGLLDKEARSQPYDFGTPFNLPNHPAVGVSWYEAVAFCHWLTQQLRSVGELDSDEAVTLPTENHWEKAARGPDGPIYPWGNEADPERANYAAAGIEATSAVGCFPGGASVYGVEEMSGNVWEWCRTKWQANYKNYQDDNDLEGGSPRVVRGGAFYSDGGFVRCAARVSTDPFSRDGGYGFRVCVVGVSPSSL